MKGKRFFMIVAILGIFGIFVFGGFSLKTNEIEFTVFVGETEKTYKYPIGVGDNLKRIFIYGKSYEKFSKKEFSGDSYLFLRHLNGNIIEDIERLCEEYFSLPVEPSAVITADGFVYKDAVFGRKTDKAKLYEDIVFSLDSGKKVEAISIEIPPIKTMEEIKNNTREIAVFSTGYADSSDGRKRNIALACAKLDLTEIPPYGVAGFNGIVGKRTEENGFTDAKIIKNGEFVSGVGGGVCQVSTTLYNAWLLAGREVPISSTHSLTVSYVSPSLDAMVSDGSDLVLLNGSEYPAYIRAECDGKKITVRVYGEAPEYRIKLRSERIRVIAAEYEYREAELDWADGEESRVVKRGKDGLVSESYRDFYDGQTLVKSEQLRRSYYAPVKGEIAIPPQILKKSV